MRKEIKVETIRGQRGAAMYLCKAAGAIWGKVKFWPGENHLDIFDRYGAWVGWGDKTGTVRYARAGKGPLCVVALATALGLS